MLQSIESTLEEMAATAPADTTSTDEATTSSRSAVRVVIGTTQMAEDDPTLVDSITDLINSAYTKALQEMLPVGQRYERIDHDDVRNRLQMGDAGFHANRVLHLAYRDDTLVGACSSTYQPPWTPDGVGHWGLMSVLPDAQGSGVASALIAAAETRLASRCQGIQIEYEYTRGHAFSQRLKDWYEDKLGFRCPRARTRGGGDTEWRTCLKPVDPALSRQQRGEYFRQVQSMIVAELAQLPDSVEGGEADEGEGSGGSNEDEEEDEAATATAG